MRLGTAYKLTFNNGGVYIGITREPLKRRIDRHINYARSGKPYALSCAIRKYGESSFNISVVGSGTWEELKRIEVNLIAEQRALGIRCYNMTGGGEGSLGVNVPLAVREKISQSLSGRTLSISHRENVSLAQKGKIIPQETRDRMRSAAMGRVMSASQREKISKSLMGRKQSPEVIAKRVSARRENGSY